MTHRVPWEIVETLPTGDDALLAAWQDRVDSARDDTSDRVVALVGRALSRYWAVHSGLTELDLCQCTALRRADLDEALTSARRLGDPDLVATALLGTLYALWGPDDAADSAERLQELARLRTSVKDVELRLRISEWVVLAHLEHGELSAAAQEVEAFRTEAEREGLHQAARRVELWQANLAMCRGRIDEAVEANRRAIAATADIAGSPFSFQNVAITLAIERFLRRGLDDLIEALRSILASSPRVAPNWETGLAFALSEIGELAEARTLFETLARDRFARVPRDLNWLVTMHLLGLVGLRLDDRDAMATLVELLEPFGELDAVHGSGYASYGPVGRVLGSLTARLGSAEIASEHFAFVLSTREPGPWTSLTRLDRAIASAQLDPAATIEDAELAEAEFVAFAMPEWAEVAHGVRRDMLLDGHGGPIAVRQDDTWHLRHRTGTAEIRHSIGVAQLVELLARPGTSVEAFDLDTNIDPGLPRTATGWELLDPQARRSYRRRLAELEHRADPSAVDEIEHLRRALAGAAITASGEPELERARVRVTKSLRRTISAVGELSAPLAEHLSGSVITGRRCLYSPPDGIAWEIDR